MKKTFQGIVTAALLFLLMNCKKSDSTPATTSAKTDLLTKQDWVTTKFQHKAVSASTWTDDFGSFKTCQKDDRVVFRVNNTVENNEGPTKCTASDPQIKGTGSWNFAENENVLVIKNAAGVQSSYGTISILSATALEFSFTIVDQGVTYQFVEAFAH